MYKLRINPLARQDLLDIKEYIINELDSPTAAVNVVSKIIESYEKLKEFPMLGIELSSRIDVATDYRYLISGKYMLGEIILKSCLKKRTFHQKVN